jgi:hypothetical protein
MEILDVYRGLLLATPAVHSQMKGTYNLFVAAQGDLRPNMVLQLGDSGEDYTHQGTSGVVDAEVILISRGDTSAAASQLAKAVHDTVKNFTGTLRGIEVQLTEAMSTKSSYDATNKVFEITSTYTSFYRKVSP